MDPLLMVSHILPVGLRARRSIIADSRARVTQSCVVFLWATFETFFRGFLLGFGAVVCKDHLLSNGSDDKPDTFNYSFAKAKMAGLGVGCFLTGSAIIIPHDLRQKYLT